MDYFRCKSTTFSRHIRLSRPTILHPARIFMHFLPPVGNKSPPHPPSPKNARSASGTIPAGASVKSQNVPHLTPRPPLSRTRSCSWCIARISSSQVGFKGSGDKGSEGQGTGTRPTYHSGVFSNFPSSRYVCHSSSSGDDSHTISIPPIRSFSALVAF